MPPMLVSILSGSQSNWVIREEISKLLDKLTIPHEARALSAYRTTSVWLQKPSQHPASQAQTVLKNFILEDKHHVAE